MDKYISDRWWKLERNEAEKEDSKYCWEDCKAWGNIWIKIQGRGSLASDTIEQQTQDFQSYKNK